MSEAKFGVHIDSSEKREDLPEFNHGPCPHCGGETEVGHGLAGGGFGIYSFCPQCELITSKSELPD